MKKTSKLFGALALSAALAMGVTPAFAATDGSNTGSTEEETEFTGIAADGKGTVVNKDSEGLDQASSTVVNVSTYTSQLSVTVPLKLPVVLDRAGGLGKTPTNYFIQNNSGPDIDVTKAAYTILDEGTNKADWNFATSDEHLAVDAAATRISGTSASPVNPAAGTVMLSFAPTDTTKFTGSEWFTKASSSTKTQEGFADMDWVIPGTATKSAEADRKCVTTVKASSSVLGKEADDLNLAGIVYTVGLHVAE